MIDIQRETTFTMICDNCKKQLEDQENCTWLSVSKLNEVADASSWFNDDGLHYCPSCYEFDDNDQLILLK